MGTCLPVQAQSAVVALNCGLGDREAASMDLVELLTVADRFQLSSGLVLVPDFLVPKGWKPRSETVVIVKPNG
jgi:hypothetical protein